MSKSKGASLKIDDAFNPKHLEFTECECYIQFFLDGESVQVQVGKDDKHDYGFRMPLYAATALAQMLTSTLNGQRLLK